MPLDLNRLAEMDAATSLKRSQGSFNNTYFGVSESTYFPVADLPAPAIDGPPEGWDWRTATEDWAGDPVPNGAQGFDAYGRPYYGDGFWGWIRKTIAGITDPWINETEDLESPFADIINEEGEEESPGIMGVLGNTLNWVMTAASKTQNAFGGDVDEETGQQEATFLTGVSRTFGAVLQTVFDVLQLPALAIERGIGGAAVALSEVGEGSTLPELPQIFDTTTPPQNWIEGAARILGTLNPFRMAWDLVRAVEAPGTLAEKGEEFGVAFQAGRIAYTAFYDVTVREEFMREIRAGENAQLLSLEYGNPVAEAVGQIVFDPLNLIGWWAKGKGVTKGGRWGRTADDLVLPPQNVQDAILAQKAATAAGDAVALEKATTSFLGAIKTNVMDVIEGNATLRSATGWMAPTTEAMRSMKMDMVGGTLEWLARNTEDPEQLYSTMKALVRMASGKVDDIDAALGDLGGFLRPDLLLSRQAMETGQVLKNIVAAKDGTVTLARLDGFISELKAVLAIEDVADPMKALTNFAEAKMGKNLATMFPTIAKRIELGEEVGWWAENLNKFHGVAQSTAMRPLNTFFASIYMGLSPGYAFRNMMSNGIHILVDQGVGAFIGRSKIGKPGWITPKAGLDNIEGWLGGLYTRGIRGFSQAPEYRLAEGTIGRKLFQPFLRLSEHFEKNGAIRVINKTVEDAMRSMLRPGRALPDIAPLRAAGMSDDAASALLDFVVARKGNIKAAMGDWSNAVASGSVDAGKTFIWADAEDLRKLDSILPGGRITDRLRLALQDAETLEDALKSVDGIWTEIRETAGLVATEVPMQGLTDAERWVGGGTSDAAIAARDEGFMLEETSNTISYQIKANSDSFDASQDAVMSTYESLRHELAGMGMLEKTVDGVKIDIVEEAMKPFEPITTRSLLARFTAEDQEALEVVWGLSNKWGKADDGTDWAKEWVAAGLTGVPPTNLNKRLLKNWLWDERL
ncbi:MAG: hypothetical protein JRE40_03015 [Deltaproteobacteria bacterium]|nr:hypothetical protein [Deltaproteobacteria bacterium]